MNELENVLSRLGLSQYLDSFRDEGFDTWETLVDITESDLDALNVKLGHRRKLQREIANSRGSREQLVPSIVKAESGKERRRGDSEEVLSSNRSEGQQSGSTGKRKYRRHPKPDENAPERPPSAYVIFSNKTRETLKPQNLSFTDIAKRVGECWQDLSPEDKEPFEKQAAAAKERYNADMRKYKTTESYREYSKYLADFKARNAEIHGEGKRPRLEHENSSAGSPGVAISQDESEHGRAEATSHGQMCSPASGNPSPRIYHASAPSTGPGRSISTRRVSPSTPHTPLTAPERNISHTSPTQPAASSLMSVESLTDKSPVSPRGQQTSRYATFDEKDQRGNQGGIPVLKTELSMPQSPKSSPMESRRSDRTPASLKRNDTSRSSIGSSYGSNMSTISTVSSMYSSSSYNDDSRLNRTLPPPSSLYNTPSSNVHGDQGARTPLHGHSLLRQSPDPSLQQHNFSSSSDHLREQRPTGELRTSSTPESYHDLQSHSQVFHDEHENAFSHRSRPYPPEREARTFKREDSEQSSSNPLSVLAYAGNLVDSKDRPLR